MEVKRRICWASLLLIRHSAKKTQRQTIHLSSQSRLESRVSTTPPGPSTRIGDRDGAQPTPARGAHHPVAAPATRPANTMFCLCCRRQRLSAWRRGGSSKERGLACLALGGGSSDDSSSPTKTAAHKPGTPTSDTTPTPAISRAMPLRVLKRMARGESPLPAVPRAVTDCDRIKVDRQTASQQTEDSDEGGPERIASSPLRMALIQLPLGSPFPAAGWGPVRNTAKLIAPPLDLGARAAPSGLCLHTITPCRQLRRPWPMQVPQHCSSHGENKKKKSCPPPRQPVRASRRRTSPSPTWAGGLEPPRPTRRAPLFLPSHSALLGAGGGAGSWWSGRWAKPVRDI